MLLILIPLTGSAHCPLFNQKIITWLKKVLLLYPISAPHMLKEYGRNLQQPFLLIITMIFHWITEILFASTSTANTPVYFPINANSWIPAIVIPVQ